MNKMDDATVLIHSGTVLDESAIIRKNKKRLTPHVSQSPYFLNDLSSQLSVQCFSALKQWHSALRHAQVTLDGETSQWRFKQSPLMHDAAYPLEWVELSSGDKRLWMVLLDDRWCDVVGARCWEDYDGESRLLSMMLSHQDFFNHLHALFGIHWQPCRFVDKKSLNFKKHILLHWSCEKRDKTKKINVSGLLLIDSVLLEQWSHSDSWEKQQVSEIPSWCQRIPFMFDVLFYGAPFLYDDLAVFESGDIMILECADRVCSSLKILPLQKNVYCYASIDPRSFKQITLLSGFNMMEEHMINDNVLPDSDEKSDVEARDITKNVSVVDDMKQLPINVNFKLGAVNIPLMNLLSMQEGFVFELPQRIDQLHVQVFANGALIGRGDLVAVGEYLGVRLKEIDLNGVK
jgi:flagellar motor switch/type III secretory pathway protein FliN